MFGSVWKEKPHDMDLYVRAANHLSLEQVYLMDDPLLRDPLGIDQIKPPKRAPSAGAHALGAVFDNPDHPEALEAWMRSDRPEEPFDEKGRPIPALRELAPEGRRRMSANPRANGGILLETLKLTDFQHHAVAVPEPGISEAESTRVLGGVFRDVLESTRDWRNFRVFGPDVVYAIQAIREEWVEHRQYIREFGEDLPEVRNWKWGQT
jgi:phosphoketolase